MHAHTHTFTPTRAHTCLTPLTPLTVKTCAEVVGEEACADIIAMGDALGNVHFLDFPQERQVCGYNNPY